MTETGTRPAPPPAPRPSTEEDLDRWSGELRSGEREFVLDVKTQDLEVNMGPQHPSTHGVLRVLLRADGEIVTGAQPHLGYLHRCAEKIGENVEFLQYLPYTDRYDYLSAMNNNLGYSMAVEKVAGIEIPERGQYVRTICAELNRIASHLLAFGTYGLDIGAITPFLYAFREREEILHLFEKVCGARLTYSYIRIGGVFNDLPDGWLEELSGFLDVFEEKWQEYNDLLSFNHIFVQRTANVGILPPEKAIAWGCTGPMLRGSGVGWDVRRDEPYLVYPRLDFQVCVGRGEKGTLGDCWDRYFVRVEEMRESVKMLRQLIRDIPDGPVSADVPRALRVPAGAGYVGIENPRGELGHYVVSEGGKVARRCRVRGPSFCNLSILPELMGGTMLADAVAIIGSVDIVIGETDR